ncbi:MAG: hypothetical protein RLZZ01_1378 [Actinomycetota bacterium]
MEERLDPLVEFADVLHRIDDLLAGVVELVGGRIGGASPERRSLERRFVEAATQLGLGERRLAARWAALHGPDQIRKAVGEAERLAGALEALRHEAAHAELMDRLDACDLDGIADRLRGADPFSDEVRVVMSSIARAQAESAEHRVRRLLADRRSDRNDPGGTG